MTVTLLVACEHHARAVDIASRLSATGAFISEATTVRALCEQAARSGPDVVLMEAGRDAFSILPDILRSARVLLLCSAYAGDAVPEYMQLGVSGCVLDTSAPSLLAAAVTCVHSGRAWFTGGAIRAPRERTQSAVAATGTGTGAARLTPRERQILRLAGQGLPNKVIARQLQISHHTVQTQLHRVYVKLRVSGRREASGAMDLPAPEAFDGEAVGEARSGLRRARDGGSCRPGAQITPAAMRR